MKNNWSLDPTIVPEKLRAMRAACRWVADGPETVGPDIRYLLRYRPVVHTDGFRLSVISDPSKIPNTGDLVVVADVNGLLYFRVFDHLKRMVVDTNEIELQDKASQIRGTKRTRCMVGPRCYGDR